MYLRIYAVEYSSCKVNNKSRDLVKNGQFFDAYSVLTQFDLQFWTFTTLISPFYINFALDW